MKRNGRVKPCERLEGGQPSFHPGSLSGPFCLTSERALSPYGLKDQAEMRAAFIPSFPRRLFSVSPISAVISFDPSSVRFGQPQGRKTLGRKPRRAEINGVNIMS